MNCSVSASIEAPTTGNEAARAYVEIFAQAPASSLIANLATRLETVRADARWLLPVSVNDGEDRGNCYVCSPRSQYVDYAAYELSRLRQPLATKPLQGFLVAVGAVFRRAELDRAVIVNNWLLSTNLYPLGWHGEGLNKLIATLVERFPGHAVLFRSLNARQNPLLLGALRSAGARLLPSRVVWHYDGATARFTRTLDYRRDVRLLERGGWEIAQPGEIHAADMGAFARLYAQLYIGKYTALNPRYTPCYLAACHEKGLLRFQGLRERSTDQWLGVVGIFERDGVLTAPIVGYDTARPRSLGLYRALMALVLRETARRGALLNLSAGAGSFKRLRGGEPDVEFAAVFDAHLPRSRRWPWGVLEALSNRVGLPLAWRMETGRVP